MASEAQARTPFQQMYDAICAHDIAALRSLVAAHPGVLKDDDNANGLLRDAAGKNFVDGVAFLVDCGADLNAGENKRSPEGAIRNAVYASSIEVVRWMLAHGAQLNHMVGGKTRCFALTSAARKGNLEMVKLLVEHGANINAYWAGETPLSFAIQYGQKEVADYLRSKGALEPWQIRRKPPPQAPPPASFIGLSEAAKEMVEESQKILLKYGIDPLFGKENPVWAPSWSHTDEYAADVLDRLRRADVAGTREDVEEALRQIAEEFIRGQWHK